MLAQASNLHLEGLMPVLRDVIDVITMKSDRPVRRLVAYYAIVAIVVAILAFFF